MPLHSPQARKLFLISIYQQLQTSIFLHALKLQQVFEVGTAFSRLNKELLTGVDTTCNRNTLVLDFTSVVGMLMLKWCWEIPFSMGRAGGVILEIPYLFLPFWSCYMPSFCVWVFVPWVLNRFMRATFSLHFKHKSSLLAQRSPCLLWDLSSQATLKNHSGLKPQRLIFDSATFG